MSDTGKYSVGLGMGGQVWFVRNIYGKNVCGVAWTMFNGQSDEAKEFADHVCELLNDFESDIFEDVDTQRKDLITNEEKV